mgnify:CR=1 FL=1
MISSSDIIGVNKNATFCYKFLHFEKHQLIRIFWQRLKLLVMSKETRR